MELSTLIGVLGTVGLILGLSVYSGTRMKGGAQKNGAAVTAGLIMGTLVGGSSTVGTAQLAYNYGMSAWWFTLGGGISCLILALCFAGPLRHNGGRTLIGMIEKEFGGTGYRLVDGELQRVETEPAVESGIQPREPAEQPEEDTNSVAENPDVSDDFYEVSEYFEGEPTIRRKQFTFYESFLDALQGVSPRSRSAALMALVRYSLYGEKPRLKGSAQAFFSAVKPSLLRARQQAAAAVERIQRQNKDK